MFSRCAAFGSSDLSSGVPSGLSSGLPSGSSSSGFSRSISGTAIALSIHTGADFAVLVVIGAGLSFAEPAHAPYFIGHRFSFGEVFIVKEVDIGIEIKVVRDAECFVIILFGAGLDDIARHLCSLSGSLYIMEPLKSASPLNGGI